MFKIAISLLPLIFLSGCETISSNATDNDIHIENITEQTSYEENPALYHLQTMAKSSVYGDVCKFDAYERHFLRAKEYTLKQALFRNYELKDDKEKTTLFAEVFNKLKTYYKENTGTKECSDWKELINANRSMRDINPKLVIKKQK